jgi:hypothetical protein
MFKILCLTTGSDICWPRYTDTTTLTTKLVPTDIQEQIENSVVIDWKHGTPGRVMLFNTEIAAGWFIRRRLSYNPKRTDYQKLTFVNSVFESSGMDPGMYTKKHMFQIIAC